MAKNRKIIKKIILSLILVFTVLITNNEVQAEIKFPKTSTLGIEHDTDLYEGTLDKILELNDKETVRDETDNYKEIAEYLKDNGYVSKDIGQEELNEFIEKNASSIKVSMNKFGEKIRYIVVEDCTLDLPNSNLPTNTNQENGSNLGSETIDDMFDSADDFFNIGVKNQGKVINIGNLQVTSNFIYNVLLAIAIVVAVIWGMILGIQFLIGAAEQRAETKKALVPYFIGCVVIFGAFGIWAFVVNILQSIK